MSQTHSTNLFLLLYFSYRKAHLIEEEISAIECIVSERVISISQLHCTTALTREGKAHQSRLTYRLAPNHAADGGHVPNPILMLGLFYI